MAVSLHPHQEAAVSKLKTGSVLVGDVGSGKSIAALAYFAAKHPDRKIIILTTAKKRDSGEWWGDAMKLSLRNEVVVDSWNNIKKYVHVENASFILDEQRIVGKGAWTKAFWIIANRNDWILLSATPADTWIDLMPVFVANGFYRNQTDFYEQHVVWARFVKYPKIEKYVDQYILERHRDSIYVDMPFEKKAKRVEHVHDMPYSKEEEKLLWTDRWNFYENLPVKDAAELMRLMRKSVNTHPARYDKIVELLTEHPSLIIFYNFNYELDILRKLGPELNIDVAEWNGHNHQEVPLTERWAYLVQYTAGSEGWNCVSTNQMAFYSQPYSYRQLSQAKGRIDRLNTEFEELHYHTLVSKSIFDVAINKALRRKKNFQASAFGKKAWPREEMSKRHRLY